MSFAELRSQYACIDDHARTVGALDHSCRMNEKSDDLMTTELAAHTIRPGDQDYDDAARVYMRSGSPALVVRPRDGDEVAEAVCFAHDHQMVLSVRSGGHSALSFGTNDGGLVIDLSWIDDIDVLDPDAGIVRVGAGATWGHVAATLGEYGLSLTSGDTRSVGVGGLTLGGGIGWMVRNHGLTIDSVIAAEIVTADGELLRLSDSSHPELFWAVRGGGGNFGVVTHIEYVAQRATRVHAGSIGYPVDDVDRLLLRWSTALREAPEELNASLVLLPALGPEMPASAVCLVCYAGADDAAAAAAFAPLRGVAPVTFDTIEEKAYIDVLEEAHPPPGMRAMVSNALVASVDDAVISATAGFYASGTASRVVFVRALGGAMSRVPTDATAFAYREVEAMIVGAAFVPEPCTDEQVEAAIAPFAEVSALGVGAYAGFLGTAKSADVARIYPTATYRRLAEIKRRYDPANLFNQTFNVRPF
jgi:FAD/FMN-containing dehydrogenase